MRVRSYCSVIIVKRLQRIASGAIWTDADLIAERIIVVQMIRIYAEQKDGFAIQDSVVWINVVRNSVRPSGIKLRKSAVRNGESSASDQPAHHKSPGGAGRR